MEIKYKSDTLRTKYNFSSNKKNNYIDREKDDFYQTHPDSTFSFFKEFDKNHSFIDKRAWEFCCGNGVGIAEPLKKLGWDIVATDLIDRGYGTPNKDFFQAKEPLAPVLITNPPYRYNELIIKHAYNIMIDGMWLILYLPITILEGKKRYELFKKFPIKEVYIHSSRQGCGKGGMEFKNTGARCYCWYVWQKGVKHGPTELHWIPPND